MCFSSEASFIAGTILTIAGIASVKKIQTPSQFAFACIPLLFAIQQFTEGFVWLSLQNSSFESFKLPAIYIFLSFAQIVWPTWVPLSILLLQKGIKRSKILYAFLMIGILVSVYLSYRLITNPIKAEILDHHIYYDLGFPATIIRTFGILYFIATVLPPFFSTIKKVWLVGSLNLASYIVSKLFFENYVISIWCFFGAIISVAVYYITIDSKKTVAKSTIRIAENPTKN